MTTCIKCGYSRQPDDQAPEWQCPACQVAYSKAKKSIELAQNKKEKQLKHQHEEDKKLKNKETEALRRAEAEKPKSKPVEVSAETMQVKAKTSVNGAVVLLVIVLALLALPILTMDGFNGVSIISVGIMAAGIGMIAMYFLPWLIALSRQHNSCAGIFLVNLILGWTVLFWIVCLVWSLSTNTRNQQVIVIKQ